MNDLNSFIEQSFGLATVFGQILLVTLCILFLVHKISKGKRFTELFGLISSNYLILSFFIALFAAAGSLVLSEIVNLPPCELCWYQRIFVYPQVIIFGIAALKNDFKVRVYSLVLSVIGALIALYHIFLQLYPAILPPCSDEVVSCTTKQFVVYGYVTIPVMSLTIFLMLIFLGLAAKRR